MFNQSQTQSTKAGSATQDLIDVADIRQGTIVLKNNALRAILMVSSINFALKSAQEQKALIYAYQQFLNSLDFPIQILVLSRQMDIEPYLQKMQEQAEKQNNELLRMQAQEYENFINQLIDVGAIMKKEFFIIVPFSGMEAKRETIFDKVKNLVRDLNIKQGPKFTEDVFARYKEQLWQRVDYLITGLSGMDLNVNVLDTQAILELLYNLYNQ